MSHIDFIDIHGAEWSHAGRSRRKTLERLTSSCCGSGAPSLRRSVHVSRRRGCRDDRRVAALATTTGITRRAPVPPWPTPKKELSSLELAALFDDQLAEPALRWIVFELLVPHLADAALG